MSLPFVILSDSVDYPSGLGRIARDIAVQANQLPEFRVATIGRGGRSSSRLPWPQYVLGENDGWGETKLEECWKDFARDEIGVLLTIWDASRVRWLVQNDQMPQNTIKFLNEGRFERWGYFPVDSTGPLEKLTGINADTIQKFDRVLAYGLWGKGVLERSTGRQDIEWLPHGVNFNAFQPRERTAARMAMGVSENCELIGMVATNQTRKDWGLAFYLFNQLRKQRPGIKFWIHTDTMVRHWNLYALAADYNLGDSLLATPEGMFSDTEISHYYSACNLTILPSSEGFGYPIVESLASGTPCIHSNYAGGAELVPNKDWLVEPLTYRLEGQYNNLRPVWKPQDWVNAIIACLEDPSPEEECRRSVSHLDWHELGPVWRRWLLKGVGLGG